jgi:hypothetical protein
MAFAAKHLPRRNHAKNKKQMLGVKAYGLNVAWLLPFANAATGK